MAVTTAAQIQHAIAEDGAGHSEKDQCAELRRMIKEGRAGQKCRHDGNGQAGLTEEEIEKGDQQNVVLKERYDVLHGIARDRGRRYASS